jgi:hypothetical protein
VLALSWHESVGENDVQTFPLFVVVKSLNDIKLQGFRKIVHELSPWRDYIRIERTPSSLSWSPCKLDALSSPFVPNTSLSIRLFLSVKRCPEPS